MTNATGFTLNGVAGRIRDLESKTNGAYYVGLCWLAMTRNSGRGAKKLLESKVFGATEKPTSTFRNAWRIADKAFAEGFHKAHRVAVADMGLDDAIKFAVECLEKHKAALEVSNMKDYEDVCKYAAVTDIPKEAPEPEPADEPAADDSNVVSSTNEAADKEPEERSTLDIAIAAMMALNPDELTEFAAKVNERIQDLNQTEEVREAA